MLNKKINILLTSSGRRGYLVRYFKEALNGRGLVHAGNSSNYASAFYYADRYVITPLIYDDNYISFLLDYCKQNSISVIIPLFDIDLMVLAQHKELFAQNDIIVIVSDKDVIDICNDKWKTYKFCNQNGYLCPLTYLEEKDVLFDIENKKVQYPIIVKPRWGMGSIAVYEADNEEELWVFGKKVKTELFETYLKYESIQNIDECVIFQEKIAGQEFGIDVIHDLNGNHMITVAKKKIAMRSGETDKAMVVKDISIENIGTRVGEVLGHIGNLDMDVIVLDQEIYVLELNARFGGGYPFSHCSGVNLPKAIINWIIDEPVLGELSVSQYDRIVQKDIQMIDMSQIE